MVPATWDWLEHRAIEDNIASYLLQGWFHRGKILSCNDSACLYLLVLYLGRLSATVGCTLNGCSYGRPTTLPWGIVFKDPESLAPLGIPLHPTQIYELMADIIFLAGLLSWRKNITFDGQLFLTYIMGYGVIRFLLEFFRDDSLLLFNLVPVPQVISVVIFIAGLIIYLYRSRTRRVKGSSEQTAEVRI